MTVNVWGTKHLKKWLTEYYSRYLDAINGGLELGQAPSVIALKLKIPISVVSAVFILKERAKNGDKDAQV